MNRYSFRILIGAVVTLAASLSFTGTSSADFTERPDYARGGTGEQIFLTVTIADHAYKAICDCLIVEAPRIQDEPVEDNLRLAAEPNLKRAVFDRILLDAAMLDHRRIRYDAS